MKEQIEQHLNLLVGRKLTKSTRAANMEFFQFGHLLESNNKGELIETCEFGLHLQCPWRFTNEVKILIGSADLYQPKDENAEFDENFDWDNDMGNLRDIKLHEFIQTSDLTVKSIIADNFGGFDLLFTGQITLSVFPADSTNGEHSEFWRLLNNTLTNINHFVVGGFGVQQ